MAKDPETCQNRPSVFATRVAYFLTTVAVVAGVGFRLRMLLMGRSLWLDPAMLALNVVDKSFLGLLGRLDLNQSAPFGFLLISKFCGRMFDYNELSLMLFPFLCGVAALLLFCTLARESLQPVPASIACILLAVCSTAVYYSGEFKQYSGDLFAAVLVLFLSHRLLRSDFEVRWIAAFIAGGVFAFCLSHPAPIMLGGCGIALIVGARKRGDSRTFQLVGALAVLASVYLVLYLVQIRPSIPDSLVQYHATSFALMSDQPESAGRWWLPVIGGYGSFPLGFGHWAWLSLVAIAAGLVSVVASSRNRSSGYLLVFPWLILVAASAVHLYPIATGRSDVHSRFMLFTVPLAVMLIARGVEWLSNSTPRPVAFALAAGLVLAMPPIVRMVRWPDFIRQEMRPLVADLIERLQPGDAVYVYHAAVPAFRFYTQTTPVEYSPGRPLTDGEAGIAPDLDRMPDDVRLWVVISHDYSQYRKGFVRELERRYSSVSKTRFPGAWLLLADSPR